MNKEYESQNKIYKECEIITILCFGIVVFILMYYIISSTIYTQIGFFQIDIGSDNYFYISNDSQMRKIYCNDVVYDLLCSIEEYNPNSCYYIAFEYCTVFSDYAILRMVKLDAEFTIIYSERISNFMQNGNLFFILNNIFYLVKWNINC